MSSPITFYENHSVEIDVCKISVCCNFSEVDEFTPAENKVSV